MTGMPDSERDRLATVNEYVARALWIRRVGPVYRMLLMDGSTVIATRHGLSYCRTLRRGIDANLARGGGEAFTLVSEVHDD